VAKEGNPKEPTPLVLAKSARKAASSSLEVEEPLADFLFDFLGALLSS